jgi:gamma-glutamyl-gamma-aminobutyrate hydrolase PuuD
VTGKPLRIGVLRNEPGDPIAPDNYANRLVERGCAVVDLWPAGPASIAGLAALVLIGGDDVDPALYGEAPHPETDVPVRMYDDYEIHLLREALNARLPVLAICRGFQVLNVALGGSLVQHIEGNGHRAYLEGDERISRWHDVVIEPGSRLHAIYGQERFEVNSRHHQAVTVERVAPALRATAFSPDGWVEGLEPVDHPGWLVGVQWHPERPEPQRPNHAVVSRRLFDAFLAAAREASVPTGARA